MPFFLLLAAARGLDNGVGLTPAMGVNTYQSPWPFQGGFAPAIADALTALGMKDKGYVYVNSDAGWQPKSPGRDSSGAPVPDQGCPMPETATALAAKGFRMGLYSALSSVQCGGAPGGLYHEDLDAAAYKEWGLKYLKYDNCAEYALEPNARSSPMRDALNRTGTPILFSIEPFDLTPNPQAHIANLWRTTTDVSASTEKVRVNADLNDKWAEFAGPGGFNDPDMLQCGKGKSSVNEWRSNFITWAIAKAPLLLSTNLTDLNMKEPELMALLGNNEVIALNQDEDGIQARKLIINGNLTVAKNVGVVPCSAPDIVATATAAGKKSATTPYTSMAEVGAAKQIWNSEPIPESVAIGAVLLRQSGFYSDRCLSLHAPNHIAYSPPFRKPTRPHPVPIWTAPWQAGLVLCDAHDAAQRWRFHSPGLYPSEAKAFFSRSTLSALVNEAASAALVPPTVNASTSSNVSGLSLLPETASRYGVNHVGTKRLEYKDAEVACVDRDCTQYAPLQMWYLDVKTGQLTSGSYTASINEQWLTSVDPAPSRRCLAAIPSADMAGTPAGHTEVWGGPLAGGKYVIAMQNRDAPNGTAISAPLSILGERNGFFSYSMLTSAAAKANGYARSVAMPTPLATSYSVRDPILGKDLPDVVTKEGVLTAMVNKGDTKLFVLTAK